MMRVLIMGGSGFVGQNVAAYLLSLGYDVGVYSRSCLSRIDGCVYYNRDLLVDEDLVPLLKEYQVVIYLITSGTPRASMENYNLIYHKDIQMLLKLLDSCIQSNVRRVIYASTGGTICVPTGKSSEEEAEIWPLSHYGIGKLTCEKILFLYNYSYHMENIALRLANLYGMGQMQRTGTGVITVFSQSIICGKPVTVYGNGNVVRDFLNIEYVKRAFHLAIEWKFSKKITPVFNIGSGLGLSLNQVIFIISDAVHKSARLNYLPENLFDAKYNCLSVEKAITYLRYEPPKDPKQDIAAYATQMQKFLTNSSEANI